MQGEKRFFLRSIALLISLTLAACGGDGSDSQNELSRNEQTSFHNASAEAASQEPNAPQATGNTATDGFNWFNFRREQIGLSPVVRSAVVDAVAQGHSTYQKNTDTISHEQTAGQSGYTGATLGERLQEGGYRFTSPAYAYAEIISATGGTSGFAAAESLITAIYHRFVAFEPMFKEAGSGTATVPNGYTYFTTNFVANGLDGSIGLGNFVVYPTDKQQRVPAGFLSDQEIPDPAPAQNAVGYPISVHADITAEVAVQSFTVRPRGAESLPTRLLISATDQDTPKSAAAIVPLTVLSKGTTYDVQFVGTIDGVPANRSWSFTTQ